MIRTDDSSSDIGFLERRSLLLELLVPCVDHRRESKRDSDHSSELHQPEALIQHDGAQDSGRQWLHGEIRCHDGRRGVRCHPTPQTAPAWSVRSSRAKEKSEERRALA